MWIAKISRFFFGALLAAAALIPVRRINPTPRLLSRFIFSSANKIIYSSIWCSGAGTWAALFEEEEKKVQRAREKNVKQLPPQQLTARIHLFTRGREHVR